MAGVAESAPAGRAARYRQVALRVAAQACPSLYSGRKGEMMHDQEKHAMAELAFKLGRITRQAMYQANEMQQASDLSKIAAEVLALGDAQIAPEVLMMFV